MSRRSGFRTLLAIVLAVNTSVDEGHAKQGGRPHINVVVCDKAELDSEVRLASRNQLKRILNAAGVELAWIDTTADIKWPTAFVPTSFEGCEPPQLDEYVLIVISLHSPKGATPEEMGLAYPRSRRSQPGRAYILYDRVITFVNMHSTPNGRSSTLGIILGHAMAHELGHVLIPGLAHSRDGIMRGVWGNRQFQEAQTESLLFHPAHAELLRKELLK